MAQTPKRISFPTMMILSNGSEVDCGLVFRAEGVILVFLNAPLFAQKILGRRPGGAKDFYIAENTWSSYEKKPIEEILKSNTRNLLIPYAGVVKVEISKKFLRPCRLDLKTSDNVHRLKFYGVSLRIVDARIREVLPEQIPLIRLEHSSN